MNKNTMKRLLPTYLLICSLQTTLSSMAGPLDVNPESVSQANSLQSREDAGGQMFRPALHWTTEYSNATGWASNIAYWKTLQFPDLNGDRRADVCGRASHGLYCALSTSNSFGPASYWTSEYSNAAGWTSDISYWQTLQFPDLNGDGWADVCGRASGGLYCALSAGSSFGPAGYWTTAYSNADGWASNTSYWQSIRFPDLNGDKRADVCGRASGGMYCALSTGSSFGPAGYWTTAYSNADGWAANTSYWQSIRFPDLNGDKRADVCGRASGGMHCALSTGSSFGPASYWTTAYSNATGWTADTSYWQTIQFPDLNGDGRADVCGRASGGVYCATSNH